MHSIFYFKLYFFNQSNLRPKIYNQHQMRILWILIKDSTFPVIHRWVIIIHC